MTNIVKLLVYDVHEVREYLGLLITIIPAIGSTRLPLFWKLFSILLALLRRTWTGFSHYYELVSFSHFAKSALLGNRNCKSRASNANAARHACTWSTRCFNLRQMIRSFVLTVLSWPHTHRARSAHTICPSTTSNSRVYSCFKVWRTAPSIFTRSLLFGATLLRRPSSRRERVMG